MQLKTGTAVRNLGNNDSPDVMGLRWKFDKSEKPKTCEGMQRNATKSWMCPRERTDEPWRQPLIFHSNQLHLKYYAVQLYIL